MGFVEAQVKKVKSGNLITVLCFHNPSVELFAGCTKWLIDNKYVFISVQELYDILSNRVVPPLGAVCLTVDDGWRENLFNLIPVINDRRIPICIFISTKPVEDGVFWWTICARAEGERFDKSISVEKFKAIPESERSSRVREIRDKVDYKREAMTEDEVIEISKNQLVTIGSHTVNHACIVQCTDKELIYELTESKRLLSEWIQKEVCYFSYPNGDFKGTEREMLAGSGYLLAFTEECKFLSPGQCDPFFLPRLCLNDQGSLEENICKMTGVWQSVLKRVQAKKYGVKQRA
jgi:peptidoglycan/xylan/chitin deacetylase (PgdA/CDA1 family)